MKSKLLMGLLLTSLSYAGTEAGNGGDVIVCDTNENRTVTFYDIHEATSPDLKNFEIDLNGNDKTMDEYLDMLLDRVKKYDYPRYQQFSTWRNEFFAEGNIRWVQEKLVDMPDTQIGALPANCTIEQLVILNNTPIYSEKYFISESLFNELDNASKAAMVMHEFFLRDFVENHGHENSVFARDLNENIMRSDFESISIDEYIHLLERASVTFGGVYYYNLVLANSNAHVVLFPFVENLESIFEVTVSGSVSTYKIDETDFEIVLAGYNFIVNLPKGTSGEIIITDRREYRSKRIQLNLEDSSPQGHIKFRFVEIEHSDIELGFTNLETSFSYLNDRAISSGLENDECNIQTRVGNREIRGSRISHLSASNEFLGGFNIGFDAESCSSSRSFSVGDRVIQAESALFENDGSIYSAWTQQDISINGSVINLEKNWSLPQYRFRDDGTIKNIFAYALFCVPTTDGKWSNVHGSDLNLNEEELYEGPGQYNNPRCERER